MSVPRKKPRSCIFCPNTKNITKEHVYPKWLGKHFPKIENAEFNIRSGSASADTLRKNEAIEEELRPQQGTVIGVKAHALCNTCNNVKFGNFEEKMKPLILDLSFERSRTITLDDQKELAAWITKTAMISEFARGVPNAPVIPQAERNWLKDQWIPPRNWSVWIGKSAVSMSESGFHHCFAHISIIPPMQTPNGARDVTVHSIQLELGHFVAFAVRSSGPIFLNIPVHRKFWRIWPPASHQNILDWSSLSSLTREELHVSRRAIIIIEALNKN